MSLAEYVLIANIIACCIVGILAVWAIVSILVGKLVYGRTKKSEAGLESELTSKDPY